MKTENLWDSESDQTTTFGTRKRHCHMRKDIKNNFKLYISSSMKKIDYCKIFNIKLQQFSG